MDNTKIATDDHEFVFPQLSRFTLLKVNAERVLTGPIENIESTISERVTLRIEKVAKTADASVKSKPEVTVFFTFDAKWRQKVTEEPAANFFAEYKAVFHFKNEINAKSVSEFGKIKLYREFLIAQAYPLARSHMISELRALGINTNRPLGFDAHNNSVVRSESTGPSTKLKTPRKKNLLQEKT